MKTTLKLKAILFFLLAIPCSFFAAHLPGSVGVLAFLVGWASATASVLELFRAARS